jgi:hypothetical protein
MDSMEYIIMSSSSKFSHSLWLFFGLCLIYFGKPYVIMFWINHWLKIEFLLILFQQNGSVITAPGGELENPAAAMTNGHE